MTFTIRKRYTFSASHQLKGLPEDHQCSRLHGHNYTVLLELRSDHLREPGFVVDYGDLRAFKKTLDLLDHQHLNDLLDFNPTAELLAQYLYGLAKRWWPEVSAVQVCETENTWAEYRP